MGRPPLILVDIGAPAPAPVTPAPTYWAARFGQPIITTSAPAAPASFAATGVAGGVLIAWDASPVLLAQYVLQRAPDVSGSPGTWGMIAQQSGTQYTDTPPDHSTYWYRVRVLAPNAQPGDWTTADSAASEPVPTVQSVTDAQTAADAAQDDATAAQSTADTATDLANAAQTAANTAQDYAESQASSLQSQVNVLTGQVGDIMAADAWDANKPGGYPDGDLVQSGGYLYRSLKDSNTDALTVTTSWEKIGQYASLGDAVGDAVVRVGQTELDIDGVSSDLSLLGAHNAAKSAWVLSQSTVKVDGSTTLGQYIASVQSDHDGVVASVNAEASTRASADSALSGRTSVIEARMPSGSGDLATEASLTSAQSTLVDADTALGQRIDVTEARIGNTALLLNGSFEGALGGAFGWGTDLYGTNGQLPSGVSLSGTYFLSGAQSIRFSGVSETVNNGALFEVHPGDKIKGSMSSRTAGATVPPAGAEVRIHLSCFNAAKTYTGRLILIIHAADGVNGWTWTKDEGDLTVPDNGITYMTARVETVGLTAGSIIVDDVRLSRQTAFERANATAIAATTATVTQHGTDIDANTTAIASANVAIAGKASSSSVNSLSNTVTQHDGTLSTQASQISSLQTTQGSHTSSISTLLQTTDGLSAQAALVLDVNGKVSGVKASSTATESNVVFDFDYVTFVSSDGSFEITGGRQISRGGGYMSVQGKPFGTSDQFLTWFGPNLATPDQCDTSSALMYMTTAGVLYAPQLSTDNFVFTGSSVSLSTSAVATANVNQTVGNPKAATYTYTSSVQVFTSSGESASVTLELWRKIGTGSYTMLVDQALTSTIRTQHIQQPNKPDRLEYYLEVTGSYTYTDSSTTQDDIDYQVRISSRAGTTAPTIQNLFVKSVEHLA